MRRDRWDIAFAVLSVAIAAAYFIAAGIGAYHCGQRGGVYVLRLPVPLGACVAPLAPPAPDPGRAP